MTAGRWICTACGRPVNAGNGCVQIADADDHRYPRRDPPPDWRPPPGVAISICDVPLPPVLIEFAVYHDRCDPHPDLNPYWIAVERAATLEAWCRWVMQLCGKRWTHKRDVRAIA